MVYRKASYGGNGGRMGDNRVSWCRTILGVFDVRQFLPSDDADKMDSTGTPLSDSQVGPNVRLSLALPGFRKPTTLNLTACTKKELEVIRSVINLAIDLAVPVATRRDEVAANAAKEGDDSYARVYRQVPELVVREGKLATYSEGVWVRSENVPAGPGGHGPDAGGHRDGAGGAGAGVAVEEPEDAGPEDDGPTPDEPEGVHEVERLAGDVFGLRYPEPWEGDTASLARRHGWDPEDAGSSDG